MSISRAQSPAQSVRLLIRGRVQGVGYRASAADAARRLGLLGWVRNLRGGEVELVAEGDPAVLEKLIEWCRRGPPASRVDSVEVEFSTASGEFSDFAVRRDT